MIIMIYGRTSRQLVRWSESARERIPIMSRQRNESWSGQFHPPINSRISDVQARLLRATISTLHFHSFFIDKRRGLIRESWSNISHSLYSLIWKKKKQNPPDSNDWFLDLKENNYAIGVIIIFLRAMFSLTLEGKRNTNGKWRRNNNCSRSSRGMG